MIVFPVTFQMESKSFDVGFEKKTKLFDTEFNNYIPVNGSAPKIGYVVLPASAWTGSGNRWSQVVAINSVTKRSQVDLTPSVEQLLIFYEKDLTFVTENNDGVVTVYAIGQKPTNDYTIQVTITEVLV